jgi:hypothetical protein
MATSSAAPAAGAWILLTRAFVSLQRMTSRPVSSSRRTLAGSLTGVSALLVADHHRDERDDRERNYETQHHRRELLERVVLSSA